MAVTKRFSADAFRLGSLADPDDFQSPIELADVSPEQLCSWLRKLVAIRCTEEKIGEQFGVGVIKCPCHLVIGQEAPAVGVAKEVRPGDRVFGAHRSHAHFLALGGSLYELLAEVLGKETGCSKGMGGSMHLLDRGHQFFGSVPIVGATVPIATGAALASQMDNDGSVAVSFLGDGATEEGVFHESLNLASVMKLPVIYVVEHNLFSSHLHISKRQPFDSTCRFAEAHGVSWQRVDGNDVVAVNMAARCAFESARAGQGPQLVEAVTYRWRGHVGHREDVDVGVERKQGLEQWKRRDPIKRLAMAMAAASIIDDNHLKMLTQQMREEIESVWSQVSQDPYPEPGALLSRVYAEGV